MTTNKRAAAFWAIDPTLRVETGHDYEYTKLVLEAASDAGYVVRAFGANDAVAAIREEPWFLSAFSEPAVYISQVRGASTLPMVGLRWVLRELKWYSELLGILKHAELTAGDIVFIHSLHNPSIWQWRLVQDWFEKRRVHLFLFFRVFY